MKHGAILVINRAYSEKGEFMSITEQIEKVKEEMCSSYCKYPDQEIPEGKTEDWLFEEGSPCENCPLNKL
jgi:hypothetical protein